MIVCLTGYAWAADGSIPSTESEAQQDVFTAYDLCKVVSDDLDTARAQYLNETVQVKGTVASTYMSRYLTPNVTLSDRGAEITCVLPYLDVAKLSSFKQGQLVTISGRVHVMSENRVLLKECKTVE